MIGQIRKLNTLHDYWRLSIPSSKGDYETFDFRFLPNDWFKKIHKEAVIECIIKQSPKVQTLQRYSYSVKHFFRFLKEYDVKLKTYADLTNEHVQMFIFYLQLEELANSTSSVCLSALKWIVLHGQKFEYDGFPEYEIFDGDEYQAVKTEDVLKTKLIPDLVMKQLEEALVREENKLLSSLLVIGIDTGIRLSEALDLTLKCISDAPNDTPILQVQSRKNNTERYIPVSNRVKKAIDDLEKLSLEGRNQLGSANLTVHWKPIAHRFDRLLQDDFRDKLSRFIKKHQIVDSNGRLYNLNYHAFRHTLGTEMLNKGMTMFEIQEYLGHNSLHSTAGYAKILDPTVIKDAKKIGFVGLIIEELNEKSIGDGAILDQETIRTAALPDGLCKKPITNEGKICKKFNMCLLCPKFITTPGNLSVHRNHLDRLRADKSKYMAEEYIGTFEHLTKVEDSLEELIRQLEAMIDGR